MSSPAALTKIEDVGLREFASQTKQKDCARSVIVEVDVPIPKVAPSTAKARHSERPLPIKRHAVALDAGFSPKEMDEVERHLGRLKLSEVPVRLDSAGAFVVTADARQLRAIESLPLVRAIRPNRTHRAPSAQAFAHDGAEP